MAKIPETLQSENQQTKNNKILTLISFFGSFIEPLVGIIAGHIALKEYKKEETGNQEWKPLALSGVIIGYVNLFIRIQIGMFMLTTLMFSSGHHNNMQDECMYNPYAYECNMISPMPMDAIPYGAGGSAGGYSSPSSEGQYDQYMMSPQAMIDSFSNPQGEIMQLKSAE